MMGEGSVQIHLTDRLDSMFIIGSGIPTESNAHARRMIIPPVFRGEMASIGDRSVRSGST